MKNSIYMYERIISLMSPILWG